MNDSEKLAKKWWIQPDLSHHSIRRHKWRTSMNDSEKLAKKMVDPAGFEPATK